VTVTPGEHNSNGTATYNFTPATLTSSGQAAFAGTLTSASVLIDVQGSADVSNITLNGVTQVPTTPATKRDCKHGSWRNFTSPAFASKHECTAFFKHAKHDHQDNGRHHGHGDDDD
jgi:hypothetical protein